VTGVSVSVTLSITSRPNSNFYFLHMDMLNTLRIAFAVPRTPYGVPFTDGGGGDGMRGRANGDANTPC
jgi:hypothetical protein